MIVVNSYRFGKLDISTQALLDQAATDGYTAASGSVLTALDTYIKELKSAGMWSLMDVIYLPATNGDIDFACYNLKDPTQFNLVRVGGLTFTSLEGFTGNGSNAYLNTNFTPSVNGVNYQLNSASIGVYMRSIVSGLFKSEMGVFSGSFIQIVANQTIGSNIGMLNSAFTGNPTLPQLSSGFIHVNRSVSTQTVTYVNGSGNYVDIANSTSLPTQSITLLARNGSTASQASDGTISHAFIGGDISSVALEKYNAIQNYMTALGTQV